MESDNIQQASDQLNKFLDYLEARYYVTVHSRGGAYGGSRLVLRDKETSEEYEFERT